MRILLVDDKEDHLRSAKDELRCLTTDFVEASSVEEARQAIDQERARLDVAVVDMQLGDEAVGGLLVVSHLRQVCPSVGAVVWTAHPHWPNANEAAAVGAHYYVPKGNADWLRLCVVWAAEDCQGRKRLQAAEKRVAQIIGELETLRATLRSIGRAV